MQYLLGMQCRQPNEWFLHCPTWQRMVLQDAYCIQTRQTGGVLPAPHEIMLQYRLVDSIYLSTNLYWSLIHHFMSNSQTESKRKYSGSDSARTPTAPSDLREQFAVADSMHVSLSLRPRRPRSLYRPCSGKTPVSREELLIFHPHATRRPRYTVHIAIIHSGLVSTPRSTIPYQLCRLLVLKEQLIRTTLFLRLV